MHAGQAMREIAHSVPCASRCRVMVVRVTADNSRAHVPAGVASRRGLIAGLAGSALALVGSSGPARAEARGFLKSTGAR